MSPAMSKLGASAAANHCSVPSKWMAGWPLTAAVASVGCLVGSDCDASLPLPDWSFQRETLPPLVVTPASALSQSDSPSLTVRSWPVAGFAAHRAIAPVSKAKLNLLGLGFISLGFSGWIGTNTV